MLPVRLLLALGVAGAAVAAPEEPGYVPWPEDAVEIFARIPVQDDGRVKPLLTVAHWKLIELSGKSKLATATGEEARAHRDGMPPGREGMPRKLSAAAWMLDVLFRPDQAVKYPVFLVDDSSAVKAIGVEAKRKKRDYYSYEDLLPGRAKLADLYSSYSQKASRQEKLTALEDQIMILGGKVNTFEFLATAFAPGQPSRLVNPAFLEPEVQSVAKNLQISGLLERMPDTPLDAIISQIHQDSANLSEDQKIVMSSLKLLFFLSRSATTITLFPPRQEGERDWISPGALIATALEGENKEPRGWALERIKRLERLGAASRDPSTFAGALEEFRASIQAEADARGEAQGIDKEFKLYDQNILANSKVLFLLGFVCMLLSWINPPSKFGRIAATAGLWTGFAGLAYLVHGMTLRSQIRGWAPITNLYETFLFIAASGFVFGVLFEYFNPKRNRIAVSVGLFIAALCLLLSGQFVKLNPGDTLPPLVAVLRSNFWLTTHVITITLGYTAGILGALVAHFWIVGKALGVKPKDRNAYRNISRMTYGVVLFSLLFSLVGTVLGGIWANYSWGRFWGWDPKENGALMIVLWTLLILHARAGGYIRSLGLHVLTILLGCIIAFSWFGVNALGVGLHSYGFASGIWTSLKIFWAIEGAVLLLAVWVKVRERMDTAAEPERRLPAES